MLTKNEIKYIRLLQDKKHRDREQRFVAEGTKWVQEAIAWKPEWIENLYATQDWFTEYGNEISHAKKRIIEPFELEKISALSHPAPVVAVLQKPEAAVAGFSPGKWNLLLDGIQDPGNLGSIIRIADWFGLQTIWCSPDCADAFNPKVVQATMGSLCRVVVCYAEPDQLLPAKKLPLFTTAMEGTDVFQVKAHEGILVIGNEGRGVRQNIAALSDYTVTIPRAGHAESLNAAVATGILVAKLTASRDQPKGH